MKVKLFTQFTYFLLFFLTFLFIMPVKAQAATYYVAPNGNDSNNGGINSPFRNISKAVTLTTAGDTIYLRGGIYNETNTINLSGVGPNGNVGNMIKLWNYPGEKPIFDFSSVTRGVKVVYFANKSYWHIKGIEFRNMKQSSAGEFFLGFYIHNANNNIFENFNIHHLGAIGLAIDGSSDGNLVLNSDFHHNNDFYSNGGNADGMGYGVGTGTNTVRGCRIWLNSDDGIDAYNFEGKLIIENNWVFWNGYYVPEGQPDSNRIHNGDGNGIKLGRTTQTSTDSYYLVTNNLAFENWQSGIDQNSALKSMTIYNNTAYKNVQSCSWGLGFRVNNYDLPHILRNNIAYKNGGGCSSEKNWLLPNDPSLIQDHNSWNSGYTVTDSDFVSLDSSIMTGPRQSDGSLPNLPFLKLKFGSKLIDTGIDVGLSYNGTAPDLGAFEYGDINPSPSPVFSPSPTPSQIPLPCDLNHDGLVNVLDLNLVLNVWGSNSISEDLNTDGQINSLDTAVILNNWNP